MPDMHLLEVASIKNQHCLMTSVISVLFNQTSRLSTCLEYVLYFFIGLSTLVSKSSYTASINTSKYIFFQCILFQQWYHNSQQVWVWKKKIFSGVDVVENDMLIKCHTFEVN